VNLPVVVEQLADQAPPAQAPLADHRRRIPIQISAMRMNTGTQTASSTCQSVTMRSWLLPLLALDHHHRRESLDVPHANEHPLFGMLVGLILEVAALLGECVERLTGQNASILVGCDSIRLAHDTP
jgi:hypothetical protein